MNYSPFFPPVVDTTTLVRGQKVWIINDIGNAPEARFVVSSTSKDRPLLDEEPELKYPCIHCGRVWTHRRGVLEYLLHDARHQASLANARADALAGMLEQCND